jgi:F0F1-type ATP synthase epsilon subunit
MKVKIHTAGRKILEAEAREIILPGGDGEFSILDFHQPCVYSLRTGKIKIKRRDEGRTEEKVAIKRGVAKVVGNELVVLAET